METQTPFESAYGDRYQPVPWSGCWIWTGSQHGQGYGLVRINKKTIKAHRISYEMHTGLSAKGKVVRHKCDVPECVNPDHLEIGTQGDNVRDMMDRDRNVCRPRFGEQNPMSKLNESQVRLMRKEYAAGGISQQKIAEKYGVTAMTANRCINRVCWSEVE